jgi:hypothetical protein
MQELSRQAPQHPKKATMKMITPATKKYIFATYGNSFVD